MPGELVSCAIFMALGPPGLVGKSYFVGTCPPGLVGQSYFLGFHDHYDHSDRVYPLARCSQFGLDYLLLAVHRAMVQHLAWCSASGVTIRHLLHCGSLRNVRYALECSLVFHSTEIETLLRVHGVSLTLCAHAEATAIKRRWRELCRLNAYKI